VTLTVRLQPALALALDLHCAERGVTTSPVVQEVLAESPGIQRINTLEVADFGLYRAHGRRRFEIVWPS
jgi:hypothetical protein